MSHIPCRELNTWPLYYELDVRFSQIAAHSWLALMTFGLSEHNIEGCDCATQKKYLSLEIHEEHSSDNNCVLERMVRKAPGRSVPSRAALMAWFLLMARKLTRGHRPVEMTWSDVRQ